MPLSVIALIDPTARCREGSVWAVGVWPSALHRPAIAMTTKAVAQTVSPRFIERKDSHPILTM